MRRIVVLAGVAVALVVTLALSGTSVLPKLADDPHPDDTSRTVPAPSPPSTSPTPATEEPGAPLPGTVITARPAPRRCPSPPCIPAG